MLICLHDFQCFNEVLSIIHFVSAVSVLLLGSPDEAGQSLIRLEQNGAHAELTFLWYMYR